jgi:eukaryotic-like serine/threonine-protein kinase
MTPGDYDRAIELFERLREVGDEDRAGILDAECGANAALREAVAQMLEADRDVAGDSFLERPAIEDAARLLVSPDTQLPAAGTILGNYRLVARAAAGGMGVVYEAEDLRLQRRVALKILPTSFVTEGAERIYRFQREARAASQLNHPNIVSIFDAAFDQGYYYIAMEFVEGKTLRQLITGQSKPPDTRTILDIVAQTASALSVAHQAGIVHRDIKPENIMVREDGLVKVLDFGLAKLNEPLSGTDRGSHLRTLPGNLAGTIQYLSPEQVLGRPAGPRSDLFSLGVVAYELATGVRPFEGPTDGAVFDAILNRDPQPPSALSPAVDPELERIVMQALEKDPEFRFQTASDLRSACRRSSRDSNPRTVYTPLREKRRRPLALVAAGVLAGVAVLAGAVWYGAGGRRAPAAPLPVSFTQLTVSDGEETSPSISADGKQFVYASRRSGNWDIYLQRTGGSTAINLTGDYPQDDTQPALSPDGTRIAFRSEREGGGLFVMELTGENPRRIAARGYMPAWSPDGRSVVYSTESFRVPTARGLPAGQLVVVDLARSSAERYLEIPDGVQPVWSPNGHRIAYWGITAGGRRDVFTIAAAGNEPPVAVTDEEASDWHPVWAPSGAYLYFLSTRGGTMNLWRVAIDERSGRTLGRPAPLTLPAPYVAGLSLAHDGRTLIYSHRIQRNQLEAVPIDVAKGVVTGPAQAVGAGFATNFSFSPDGSQMVFDTLGDTAEDLWIMNADGTGRRRLVSDQHRNRAPAWSMDGREIVFMSDRTGKYEIWLIRPDGSGLKQLSGTTSSQMQKPSWRVSGQVIASRIDEPPAVLDPRVSEPVVELKVPAGLEAEQRVFLFDWMMGSNGEMGLGDQRREIVVYHAAEGRLERVAGANGRAGSWVRGRSGKDAGRYFVFTQGSECRLFDRELGRMMLLVSVAPNEIGYAAVHPDGRRLYYTQVISDSDLWMTRME